MKSTATFRLAITISSMVTAACAGLMPRVPHLSSAPGRGELSFVASALADSLQGPFFPAERLYDAVAVMHWIHAHYPDTRDIGLSENISVQFLVWDSSFTRLFPKLAAYRPDSMGDEWLDRSRARTGMAAFDSITDAMGGAMLIHVQRIPHTSASITVYYREPVNPLGVERAYRVLAPPIVISPLGWWAMGSSVTPRIEVGDSTWTITLAKGWGDCPAGCINWHCWRFTYRPAVREVAITLDSGPPVPKKGMSID